MRIAGTGLVASFFGRVSADEILRGAAGVRPALRNSARNCIFVFLSGGLSQSDTLDLKEGTWTPLAFEPTSYGDLRWPRGLMPKLAEHLDRLSIIRTARASALLHPLAQKWAQISRDPSPAAAAFAPHVGAVVALEKERARTVTDVLPAFISFGETAAGAGYFPGRAAPLSFSPGYQYSDDLAGNGLGDLLHPDGTDRLDRRWRMIEAIDPSRSDGNLGRQAADMATFSDDAKRLAHTTGIDPLFQFTEEEHARYGKSMFGDSAIIARNLIAANRGAHFIQLTLTGWDHHSDIYSKWNLFPQCKTLDTALGALLADLAATAGEAGGKTLLDETLVVIMSEFGRTVGPVVPGGGRDHGLRMSIALAGGGVKGGRIIGATDAIGDAAKDYGWSANRDVRAEDVSATIYSALGIDYTTVRNDDPSGRGFEYVPFAREGRYLPVDELFV